MVDVNWTDLAQNWNKWGLQWTQ